MRRILLPTILLLLAIGFWVSAAVTEIAAGVALFLFGMICLETGFRTLGGGLLEAWLRRSTRRLWQSIAFGLVSTALVQSSHLVSLVAISFVSAGMIALGAGIGIIMGANLGTTTGAWLIAGFGLRVDIAAWAMPLLVFGVILRLDRRHEIVGVGHLLLGVGFLFLGIAYMQSGFEALGEVFDLAAYTVPGWRGVFLFTGLGLVITVIMQSSHAALLVILTALAAGQITYENALALAIGANLGSAATAAVVGMAASLGGRRLAAAHVLFNVLTAAVAIALISQLMWLVDRLSALIGIAADDALLQLALFHTLFNLLGVALVAPFVGRFERLLFRYVRTGSISAAEPLFLYPEALKTTASAAAAVQKELGHLYDNAFGLIAHGLSLRRSVIRSDAPLADAVADTRRMMPLDVDDVYETRVKSLHSAILSFIAEVQGRGLSEPWSTYLDAEQQASRHIVEAVKAMKHLRKNLSRFGLSPDQPVRGHYDSIRLAIAELLRRIERLRGGEAPGSGRRGEIDQMSEEFDAASRRRVEAVNRMIRDQQISPLMATSMLNDESYAGEIARHLLEGSSGVLPAGDGLRDLMESGT